MLEDAKGLRPSRTLRPCGCRWSPSPKDRGVVTLDALDLRVQVVQVSSASSVPENSKENSRMSRMILGVNFPF